MKEIWKLWKDGYQSVSGNKGNIIKIYEPIYISNLGNVCGRSISKTNKGYLQIRYKDKSYRLHRLVGELFIPNPANKPCIDHIDTNKSNNCVSNLRWCTQAENNANILTREHMSINHTNISRGKHPKAKRVHDDISGLDFECIADYAEYIGRNPDTVRFWLQGKYKFPLGYKAHYIDIK